MFTMSGDFKRISGEKSRTVFLMMFQHLEVAHSMLYFSPEVYQTDSARTVALLLTLFRF